MILNAFGDVYNPATGEKIAGPRKPDGSGFFDTLEEPYKFSQRTDQFQHDPNSKTNTTIGAIITNGAFSKAELSKIASMARSGYARCINPVGTMADGDSIYAASIGTVEADLNVAGTLAAEVMAEAIQMQKAANRNKKIHAAYVHTQNNMDFFLFYFVSLEHVMPAPVLSAPLPGLSGSYQYLQSSYSANRSIARIRSLSGDRTVQYGYWCHEDPFHMDRLLRHRS